MSGIVMNNEFTKASVGVYCIGRLVIVAGHRQCLAETADSVTAHLCTAAIGIPQPHHDIDRPSIRSGCAIVWARPDDETIGTESTAAITNRARQCCVAPQWAIDLLEGDHEIVS
jgi:hypothetical protein